MTPRSVVTAPIRGGWYRDPAALRFIARRYLLWLGGLSLAWEIAHLQWPDLGVASIMGVLAATSAWAVVRAARLELRKPVESGA